MTEQAKAGQEPGNTPDLDVIMREGLEEFDVTPSSPQDEPIINNDTSGLSISSPQQPATPAAPAASPAPAAAPAPDAIPLDQRYKELQAAFTKTSQELAEIKARERAAAETRQRDEARNLAATEFENYAAERRAKLLTEIDALDPDADDYRVQVATLQAKCDKDIFLAGQKITAAPTTPAAGMPAAGDPPAPAPTAEEIITYVREKITSPEIGLAADDKYFWLMCSHAPDKDAQGNKITLDEQIMWAAEQTKQYHAQIAPNPSGGARPAPDPAQIAAQVNASQPLSRGAHPPATPPNQAPERDKPMSLSDAIDEANNLRRL